MTALADSSGVPRWPTSVYAPIPDVEDAPTSGGSPLPHPRLDPRTFSVPQERKAGRRYGKAEDYTRWRVNAYVRAREATLSPLQTRRRQVLEDAEVVAQLAAQLARRRRLRRQLEQLEQLRRRVETADPKSEERAIRRARGMIRRLCREYRLDHMWTLTYRGEGCHDRAQLVADMEAFGREFKARFGGKFWLAVPELHPGGHGWHVHLAVAGYVGWQGVVACWPHGNVETPKGPGGRPFTRRGGRASPNKIARYLASYIGKELGEGRAYLGEHRYFRRKGATLTVVQMEASSYLEAQGKAVAFFGGGDPARTWESAEREDWEGPPVMWLDFWRDGPRRKGGRNGRAKAVAHLAPD